MKKIIFSLISIILTLSFVIGIIPAMGTTYEYTTWKQSDPRWGSIPFGDVGDTVSKSGCAVTSIAILMVHSGAVSTDPAVFNPGIFVNWLKQNDGFTSQGWLYWAKASEYTSKFSFHIKVNISGLSKQDKIEEIKKYISEGYVIVAEVNSGGHYVAIDRVENGVAYMFDPADRGYDDLFDYAESGVLSIRLFKGPKASISTGGGTTTTPPNLIPGKMGTGTYVITSDNGLNIRSGADTSYSKVGAIPYNTTTYVSDVSNNWGKITYGGVTGWISLQYAKMTTPDYIELKITPPTKLEYQEGENLDTTGMTVTAVYSNNTTKKLTNEYTVTGYKNEEGTHTITVAYNGRGATFNVTVKSAPVNYQLGTYKILSDDGMNVRKEASTNSDVLGAVPYNTLFTVTKISGEWGYTTVDGLTGWINLKFSEYLFPLDIFTLEVETVETKFLVNNRIPGAAFKVYKVKDGVKTQTNDYIIGNYDYTTPGEKVITITLNEKTAEFTVKYFSLGDSNFDGEISSEDALRVLHYVVQKIDATQIYFNAADTDKSGILDATDALRILQCVVGKITL